MPKAPLTAALLPRKGRGTAPGRELALALPLLAALVLATSAHAADIGAGKAKAEEICSTCHGMDGLSKAMNAPNIAGQLEIYMIEQLRLYRSGKRQQEQMSIIAKDLTDEDITNLAAYYAAIQISPVKLPQ